MSRIGKVPVKIPSGVEVTIDGQIISVKGPKGDLSQEFSSLAKFSMSEETLVVSPADDSRAAQAVTVQLVLLLLTWFKVLLLPLQKIYLLREWVFVRLLKVRKLILN